MDKSGSEEFKSNGKVQLRFNWDSKRFSIDNGETSLELDDVQARWLHQRLADQINQEDGEIDADHLIYMNGDINLESAEELRDKLIKVALREQKRKIEDRLPITLFINSTGGFCNEGIAIVETIEYVRGVMGVKVIGIGQGVIQSMASVVLQPCSERFISRHSRALLHEVHGSPRPGLSLQELRIWIAEMERTNRQLASIYAEFNSAGNTEVTYWETFLAGHDKHLSATECVTLGLADGIYDPLKREM